MKQIGVTSLQPFLQKSGKGIKTLASGKNSLFFKIISSITNLASSQQAKGTVSKHTSSSNPKSFTHADSKAEPSISSGPRSDQANTGIVEVDAKTFSLVLGKGEQTVAEKKTLLHSAANQTKLKNPEVKRSAGKPQDVIIAQEVTAQPTITEIPVKEVISDVHVATDQKVKKSENQDTATKTLSSNNSISVRGTVADSKTKPVVAEKTVLHIDRSWIGKSQIAEAAVKNKMAENKQTAAATPDVHEKKGSSKAAVTDVKMAAPKTHAHKTAPEANVPNVKGESVNTEKASFKESKSATSQPQTSVSDKPVADEKPEQAQSSARKVATSEVKPEPAPKSEIIRDRSSNNVASQPARSDFIASSRKDNVKQSPASAQDAVQGKPGEELNIPLKQNANIRPAPGSSIPVSNRVVDHDAVKHAAQKAPVTSPEEISHENVKHTTSKQQIADFAGKLHANVRSATPVPADMGFRNGEVEMNARQWNSIQAEVRAATPETPRVATPKQAPSKMAEAPKEATIPVGKAPQSETVVTKEEFSTAAKPEQTVNPDAKVASTTQHAEIKQGAMPNHAPTKMSEAPKKATIPVGKAPQSETVVAKEEFSTAAKPEQTINSDAKVASTTQHAEIKQGAMPNHAPTKMAEAPKEATIQVGKAPQSETVVAKEEFSTAAKPEQTMNSDAKVASTTQHAEIKQGAMPNHAPTKMSEAPKEATIPVGKAPQSETVVAKEEFSTAAKPEQTMNSDAKVASTTQHAEIKQGAMPNHAPTKMAEAPKEATIQVGKAPQSETVVTKEEFSTAPKPEQTMNSDAKVASTTQHAEIKQGAIPNHAPTKMSEAPKEATIPVGKAPQSETVVTKEEFSTAAKPEQTMNSDAKVASTTQHAEIKQGAMPNHAPAKMSEAPKEATIPVGKAPQSETVVAKEEFSTAAKVASTTQHAEVKTNAQPEKEIVREHATEAAAQKAVPQREIAPEKPQSTVRNAVGEEQVKPSEPSIVQQNDLKQNAPQSQTPLSAERAEIPQAEIKPFVNIVNHETVQQEKQVAWSADSSNTQKNDTKEQNTAQQAPHNENREANNTRNNSLVSDMNLVREATDNATKTPPLVNRMDDQPMKMSEQRLDNILEDRPAATTESGVQATDSRKFDQNENMNEGKQESKPSVQDGPKQVIATAGENAPAINISEETISQTNTMNVVKQTSAMPQQAFNAEFLQKALETIREFDSGVEGSRKWASFEISDEQSGVVKTVLETENGKLQIMLIAEDSEKMKYLQDTMKGLQEHFTRHGYENVHIEYDYDRQHRRRNEQQQSRNFARQKSHVAPLEQPLAKAAVTSKQTGYNTIDYVA